MAAARARSLRTVPGFFSRPQGCLSFYYRSLRTPPPSTRTRLHAKRVDSFVARRWASASTPHSFSSDPAELEAFECLKQGNQKLMEDEYEAAKRLLKRSFEIKQMATTLVSLGCSYVYLEEYDKAIASWKQVFDLQPSWESTVNAHYNIARTYMMSPFMRLDLAVHHFEAAMSISPEDPDIPFILSCIRVQMGQLEEALANLKRCKELGLKDADEYIEEVVAEIREEKSKAKKLIS